METQEKSREAQGFKPAPAEYFSGKAWIKSLVIPDEHTDCTISDVLFEPGARNNWHVHPSNQILIIKEGICYYQEEGQAIRKVATGEVINILPGVKHWHGAAPDQKMIHIAININSEKGMVNWLERVTDEQYLGEHS